MTNRPISSNTLFAKQLLRWYAKHARAFPWRGSRDPYAIWISEVMLQQTRAETVIPYFEQWMQRYPTVETLATASQQEMLSAWEGLGYYGRARNIYRASRMLMDQYNGTLPDEARLLRKLPGVGQYTAAAIASIAFGKDEATLDGNIRRVLARFFNVTEDARSVSGERKLWLLAGQQLPIGRAGDYNQALMDLGASICTPKSPGCERCPLEGGCQARALGVQEQRPVLLQKPSIPHHIVTAAVISQNGRVLITCRPSHGLLGGMWEFPGGKQQDGEDLPTCLHREINEELGAEIEVGSPIGVYRHAYTHFKVTLYAYQCVLKSGEPKPLQVEDVRWVAPNELEQYPMGKIDRQISRTLVTSS